MIKEVRIKIVGDDAALNSTIDKLKKIGIVTEENGKKFEKTTAHVKKTTAAIGDMGTQAGRIERKIQNLGEHIVAAFAVHQIFEWGLEAVKAAENAEKAFNNLKFGVTNILGASSEAFNELIKQSETLSKSIGHLFTPAQLQAVQGQLAFAKVSIKDIQRILPVIADVAAKSSRSVESVTDLFIRGMQGSSKALQDFNAKFTDTGDEIQNVNVILKSLEGFAGGAADALGTLAGQEQQVASEADLMAEHIGASLAPIWLSIKKGSLEAAQSILELLHIADIPANEAEVGRASQISKTVSEILTKSKQEQRDYLNGLRETLTQGDYFAKQQAQLELDEYLKLTQKKIDARKHGNEQEYKDKAKSLNDIGKETTAQLEADIEELKNNNKEVFEETKTASAKGLAMAISRIEKEIEARKKANEKLLALQKQFEADLEQIKQKIADLRSKSEIELIDDETAKKVASQQALFEREIEMLEKDKKKLAEVEKNGTKKQKQEALELLNKMDSAIEIATQANQHRIEEIYLDADKKRLDNEKKLAEEILKLEEKKNEIETNALQIRLKQKLAQDKSTGTKRAKLEKEILIESDKLELGRLERELAMEKEAGHETVELEQQIAEQKIKIQADTNKILEDQQKEHQEVMKTLIAAVFERLSQVSDFNLKAISSQEELVKSSIDTQRALAAAGKQNTLAEKEKEFDMLERKRMQEEKKIRKAKELQTLLNLVANYSENQKTPGEAVARAVAEMALLKGVEAVYMEEGGLLGHRNKLSRGHRHKGGGDILVHAQQGEGILSRDDISKMGGADAFLNFKESLSLNFRERNIGNGNINMLNLSTKNLESRLERIEEAIKSQPSQHIDVDKFMNIIETVTENGIKTITTYKKNPLA